jgi:hypothetical protein
VPFGYEVPIDEHANKTSNRTAEAIMANEKHRDWVDTVSKLLIPVVIFVAGFVFSYQKDRNDRANQRFERESGILKLAASSNEAERVLGLKIIEIQSKRGEFSQEMLPVVQAISQGRPSDASTKAAQSILATAKQDPVIEQQILATTRNQSPTVYLQITKGEQRSLAGDLQAKLMASGFAVPSIELLSSGPVNTYVRYFSVDDKPQADKILGLMKTMGFEVEEQDFTAPNQNKVASGQMEVWIGEKQGPLLNH